MSASPTIKEIDSPAIQTKEFQRDLAQWQFVPQAHEFKSMEDALQSYVNDLSAKSDLKLFTDGKGWWCGIRKVAWDSTHFNMPIGQFEPILSPQEEITRESIKQGADLFKRCLAAAQDMGFQHISAFIDTRDALAKASLQPAGFHLMDCLVTYCLKYSDVKSTAMPENIRPCRGDDVEKVAAISAECFGNWVQNVNRFNTDPVFSNEKVRELYRLWIRNSFNKTLCDELLVYELDGEPVGFITIKLPDSDSTRLRTGRIPLNAVLPSQQGKGIYAKLVEGALAWFRAHDPEIVEIKTQIPNSGVHVVWGKLGARLMNSSYRFRALIPSAATKE